MRNNRKLAYRDDLKHNDQIFLGILILIKSEPWDDEKYSSLFNKRFANFLAR